MTYIGTGHEISTYDASTSEDSLFSSPQAPEADRFDTVELTIYSEDDQS